MSDHQDRLTAAQLAELATDAGLPLGENPERTIKYYKSLGLLKPDVVQEGSARRAYYSHEHLLLLSMINAWKSRGKSLEEIKQDLGRLLFLSDEGRGFVQQFAGDFPSSAFRPGMPLTWEEMAFLIYKVQSTFKPEEILPQLDKFISLASGESALSDMKGFLRLEKS